MTGYSPLIVLSFTVLGVLGGSVHFALLQRDTASIVTRKTRRWLIGSPLRFTATGAVLGLGAWSGTVPLLSALLGFLVARTIALSSRGGLHR